MNDRIGMAVAVARKGETGTALPARPEAQQVIGLVCAGTPAKLRESESELLRKVGKLTEKYPDAIYVAAEKRSDKLAGELLEFWGVEAVILPLNDHWKVGTWDDRRSQRDRELAAHCDKVMVFAPRGGSTAWQEYVKKDEAMRAKYPSWGPQRVFLIEYGDAPPPRPKVRRAKKKARAFA